VPSVSRLTITPVKGLALEDRDEVLLTETGVPENRRFFLVDEDGKKWSGTKDGPLYSVRARTDVDATTLRLEFADGRVLEGAVELGERRFTAFWDRPVWGHVVQGPWADALSDLLGARVELMRAEHPGGGVDDSAVSLLTEASLAQLAQQAGQEEVDGRRFRMLVHVAGTRPHEEDEWLGREVRVGDAVIRVTKQDARCRMTTRNPETGIRDFDTLKTIKAYRGVRDKKAIDFGVYADVAQPGRVRVGDLVEPL
jgi:uncharacterized protein